MKKQNLKILILIGIPASGKTTWAKEYVRKHPDYVRVNRDDLRVMLKDSQVCENKIEDMITSLCHQVIDNALGKKLNVIVDNTNLRVRYINEIIEKFKYQADIEYQVFDISLSKAIERDNTREVKVGEGVIRKMYDAYKILLETLDFQPVKKIENRPMVNINRNPELEDAVIFDIDGTLAHMNGRGPFDWHKVHKDDINIIVAEQIEFHRSLGRKIILLSGRDSVCREDTEAWLKMYGIYFDVLYMRPKDDYRKDTHIKKELYDTHIKDAYNVLCVYDDRLQVLDMWYKEGIFTFNVNQGQINF